MAAKGRHKERVEDHDVLPFRSLVVSGFKSLATPQTILLPGLTLLAGANSCGKSSAIQPLLLMKQTIEAPFDPGTFRLDGPNLRLTSASQIFTRGTSQFQIEFRSEDSESTALCYSFEKDSGIGLTSCKVKDDDNREFSFSPHSTNEELTAYAKQLGDSWITPPRRSLGEFKASVAPARCFFKIRSSRLEGLLVHPLELDLPFDGFGISQRDIKTSLTSLIHLPGLRGNPERHYSVSGHSALYPGTFDSYFASIIWQWQESGGQDHLSRIGQAMTDLGLTREVRAKKLDDTRVELTVARTRKSSKNDFINIADVGLGVSQVLPFIVALQVANPGQILFVEQPEIHLHPKSQGALSGAIIAAVNRGVIVVLETHSSILIRAIQTLVAEEKIPSSKVALHWFIRDQLTGHTEVRIADLDQDGAYGDWPADFDDVYLESEQRYMQAVMNRKKRNARASVRRG